MFRLTFMILTAGIVSSALAQFPEGVAIQQGIRPPGHRNPAEASSPQPNESSENKEPPNGKEGAQDGKEGGDASKAEETVRRPNKSAAEFDLDQLKTIRPDDEGRIQLNLRAVPWPPLIEWLGHISTMSVDWRELPGDGINLQTQQEYTVAEVRDLVNRHLLARGFTMLEDGELLTVEKIQGINSAMVPRLLPDDLESHRDFEFAKTSFELTSLIAEQAAKEFQPLVSRNGTITAFNSTNRLEVMDTVKNLRQIYRLLQQEQDPQHRDYVREFELEHISAAMAKSKLESLLGMEKTASPTNARMSRQQRQQQEMMMQMQMQQMQQNGGQPAPSSGPKPMEVSFVTSDRKNSLIVQAPPDKMAIIASTIEILDVPSDRNASLDSIVGRIQTYRLATLGPQEVVDILTQTASLDASSKLTVDEENRAIVVSAPPWDHLTIQKLIEKLDGSARQFKVVRLRRRRADQVATTIQALMVGEKKEDDNNRRGWWYPSDEQDKDEDSFRVSADVEHNWLLLWCNEMEFEQVSTLLTELGEVPNRNAWGNRLRVIDEIEPADEEAVLKRVEEAFRQMAPNPIEAHLPQRENSAEANSESDTLEPDSKEQSTPADATEATDEVRLQRGQTRFAQIIRNAEDDHAASTEKNPAAAAPVRVSRDASGRLMIQSDDPAALDLFEELLAEMKPRPKGFTVFQLKHASAFWVSSTLEEFFDEEEEKESDRPNYYYWDPWESNSSDENQQLGLGDRPKIKFVYDSDSNTIVVRNATESQLTTIRELLKIYDIPEPIDPDTARYTKFFSVKYSRASLISDTIKAAFADLLSRNDQALRQQQDPNRKNGNSNNQQQQNQPSEDQMPSGSLLGKLSIGADDTTNILIVSTQGENLMKVIESMIERLDNAAQNVEQTRVIRLPRGNSAAIADALQGAFDRQRDAKNNQQESQSNEAAKPNSNPQTPPQNRRQPARETESALFE